MFDIGWAEMAVIMLVALVVIGPKDLPKVARTIGQWTGKARALARDFQRSLDDMAREAELDEIKKSINRVGGTNLTRAVKDFVDPDDDLERAFDVEDDAGGSTRGKVPPGKFSPGKPSPSKPSNVKKPSAAAAVKALPASAEPTIQPATLGGADAAEAVPVAVSIEKAPEAAGAEQSPSVRG